MLSRPRAYSLSSCSSATSEPHKLSTGYLKLEESWNRKVKQKRKILILQTQGISQKRTFEKYYFCHQSVESEMGGEWGRVVSRSCMVNTVLKSGGSIVAENNQAPFVK